MSWTALQSGVSTRRLLIYRAGPYSKGVWEILLLGSLNALFQLQSLKKNASVHFHNLCKYGCSNQSQSKGIALWKRRCCVAGKDYDSIWPGWRAQMDRWDWIRLKHGWCCSQEISLIPSEIISGGDMEGVFGGIEGCGNFWKRVLIW